MATILEFRASRSQDPVPVMTRARVSAEIVIFPGIRYEYRSEPLPEPVPAAKPKAQRRGKHDVIET